MKRIFALLIVLILLFSLFSFNGAAYANSVHRVGKAYLGKGGAGETLRIANGRMYVFGSKSVDLGVGKDKVNAVWVFSLKDPAKPKLLGEWADANIDNIHGDADVESPLIIYKNFVIPTHGASLRIIDFSDPSRPECKTLMQGGGPIAAAIYKHYLIAINVMNEIYYFDMDKNFEQHKADFDIESMANSGIDFYPIYMFAYESKLYALGSGAVILSLTNFPKITFVKELKDLNGDEIDIDTARRFGKYVVCGKAGRGYELFDMENDKFYYTKAANIDDIELEKFAKEGRMIYAIGHIRKELVAMDAIDIVHPKTLWSYTLDKKASDLGVYMGYIYLVNGDTIDILNVAPFKDVPTDYWAIGAIKYMVSKNIISGYPDGTFKPDKIVTRAEYAKMLALSLNLDISKGRDIYADVPKTHWAYKYITAVTDAGLMKGYGKGKFGPNDTVKKEEIITTIVRLKKWNLISPKSGTFPDVPHKYWAYPYIETAVSHGLIKKVDRGLTDGNFHIKAGATRAQTAELLYRAIKK